MLRGRKVDHLVLKTGDLDKMVGFYLEVFNAAVARKDRNIGLVQLRIGDFLLDLLGVDIDRPENDHQDDSVFDHLSIEIDPLSPVEIEALSNYLGKPLKLQNLHGAKGFGTSLMIHDPDGNRIEIKFYPA